VNNQGQSQGKAAQTLEAPLLCCTWAPDGAKTFIGGCDKKAFVWDLQANKLQQIGQHESPVSWMSFVPETNCLVTASWDKSVRFWDGRTPQPAFKMDLPERVYSGDAKGSIAVFATADRKIIAYDLQKPQQPAYLSDSPLKFQTRVVRLFPDRRGYAVGSIEGRVAIQYFDKSVSGGNFAFKCHRVGNNIFAVNDIAFNAAGTFATMGSDGSFHFWDKDSKQRLKPFKRANLPIMCGAFNTNSSIFSYAVGYDWSQGAGAYNMNTMKTHIYLHAVQQSEIAPRPKQS